MVPGSTFRYGSNFWSVTFRPRLSSKHPMDAAAIPLPSDETTPPVTKMCLAIPHSGVQHLLPGANHLLHSFQVRGRIHAQRFVIGFHHANPEAVLYRSELLEPLRLLQRSDGQIRIPQQEVPPVDVQPDVLKVNYRLAGLPWIRDGRAREINRIFKP